MARKKSVRQLSPTVWTILGVTCITFGIVFHAEWPDGPHRAFLAIPLLWATGIFALIVASIEWPKWFRSRRERQ